MSSAQKKEKEPLGKSLIHDYYVEKAKAIYERSTVEELQRVAADLAEFYLTRGLHFAEVDRELGFMVGEMNALMRIMVVSRMKIK